MSVSNQLITQEIHQHEIEQSEPPILMFSIINNYKFDLFNKILKYKLDNSFNILNLFNYFLIKEKHLTPFDCSQIDCSQLEGTENDFSQKQNYSKCLSIDDVINYDRETLLKKFAEKYDKFNEAQEKLQDKFYAVLARHAVQNHELTSKKAWDSVLKLLDSHKQTDLKKVNEFIVKIEVFYLMYIKPLLDKQQERKYGLGA